MMSFNRNIFFCLSPSISFSFYRAGADVFVSIWFLIHDCHFLLLYSPSFFYFACTHSSEFHALFWARSGVRFFFSFTNIIYIKSTGIHEWHGFLNMCIKSISNAIVIFISGISSPHCCREMNLLKRKSYSFITMSHW